LATDWSTGRRPDPSISTLFEWRTNKFEAWWTGEVTHSPRRARSLLAALLYNNILANNKRTTGATLRDRKYRENDS